MGKRKRERADRDSEYLLVNRRRRARRSTAPTPVEGVNIRRTREVAAESMAAGLAAAVHAAGYDGPVARDEVLIRVELEVTIDEARRLLELLRPVMRPIGTPPEGGIDTTRLTEPTR